MKREKLIGLRKAKGLSQFALAALLHKDVSAYNRMECGATRLTEEDLLLLSRILQCRLGDLLENNSMQYT